MSRKQRKAQRKAELVANERRQSMLKAQPVGEISKFWSSAGTTFIISGLLGIMMLSLDHYQGRAAERLRITSEAVAARRDALEEFGAKLHGIVEAHYDALLAEQAWQAQRALIDEYDAWRIEKQTTLGFAKKLVEQAPSLIAEDAAELQLAERLYADYLVKRDLSVKAGSGQALCVALMSRLRTPSSRETVAALAVALRDLENGSGLPEPDAPPVESPFDSLLVANLPESCPITHVHQLVRRVSDALDDTYQEICHELSNESFALWSDLDDAGPDPRIDVPARPDGLRRERWDSNEGDARRDRAGGPPIVARSIRHDDRDRPEAGESPAASE
jgi:hypothetical protein